MLLIPKKTLPKSLRLKHRFLDLRREKLHNNIILRSQIISHIRHLMTASGFTEFQTPILTASSLRGLGIF
ncbi:tRNA synthetases class II family protein [Rickettsia amblyommatis str. Darkwater]|nr:tRNA synthetases class II family protein [Rickettsia amblyommatis str. Darkwater]